MYILLNSPRSNKMLCQAGVTLVELIVAIVIISVSVVGILGVISKVTAHSSDALVRKQAIVIAESLLEEIELRDFTALSINSPVTTVNRLTAYHIVSDYNNFSTSAGITAPDGTPISGLSNYNINPAVSVTAISAGELGAAISTANAWRITVSVTDPMGNVTSLSGYRTNY